MALRAQYDQEMLQSQIEVQNETLQYIAQEIHDNVGQTLTLVRLYLNMLEEEAPTENYQHKLMSTNNLVGLAIDDLRNLSKSLDSDFINDFGLDQSLSHELDRINKLGRMKADLVKRGSYFKPGYDIEIILFRICQEIFNNSLKHSAANNLIVTLTCSYPMINLLISDNGKGFDSQQVNTTLQQSGSGLRNIERRVTLLGGTLRIDSQIGLGTTFEIILRVVQNQK